ncbi:Copper amine oxidase N-terminal domain-containing protein [Natronincola peptidivorans]|uniref:Copper amine oxidase N-terminal domain-containing protein n=1 Tax=Natronincola peptidivorans TaxID=426128 RepID=A0A1I0H8S4_9FIRM|nr:stalk domain-containing protein [Natronincola peptidivorans]SET80164.1 Copper amine oxidase N-terminal domain-containing protein [Natronincola peptidivorans]
MTKKRILPFILVALFLFSTVPVSAFGTDDTGTRFIIGNPEYQMDGTWEKMDVESYIENGRTMIPVAHVARALGATVSWDAETQMVTITQGDVEVTLVIGNPVILRNGEEFAVMDTIPVIKRIGNGLGRTMLPVSWVAKALSVEYVWDPVLKQVTFLDGAVEHEKEEEPPAIEKPAPSRPTGGGGGGREAPAVTKYTLTATTEGKGTVTGTGRFAKNETFTLTAVPAKGYELLQWETWLGDFYEETLSLQMPQNNVIVNAVFQLKLPRLMGNIYILGPDLLYETLEASVGLTTDPYTEELGTITYEWLRDGTVVQSSTDNTYTLTLADVGSRITCSAIADNVHVRGRITSAETGVIAKAIPVDSPDWAELQSRTSTSISVVTEPGVEYAMTDAGIGWTSTGVFTGLTPNTAYRVYSRYAETETHQPSNQSFTTFETLPLEIASIGSVPPLSVLNGTSHKQLGDLLTESVTITDSAGVDHIVDIDWSLVDYDPELAGDYILIGTFYLPSGVVQTTPETPLEVQTVVTVGNPYLTDGPSIIGFSVDYGTPEVEVLALLPPTGVVLNNRGTAFDVDLSWSIAGYDPDILGDYTAIATYELPPNNEGFQDGAPLTVTTTITVEPLMGRMSVYVTSSEGEGVGGAAFIDSEGTTSVEHTMDTMVSVNAVPDDGFRFVHWLTYNLAGDLVHASYSDMFSATIPRGGERIYIAEFERIPLHTVTVTPAFDGEPNLGGFAYINNYVSTTSVTVLQGTEITVHAEPDMGNEFAEWYVVDGEGILRVSENAVYTFTVDRDLDLIAGFTEGAIHYTLSLLFAEDETTGSITFIYYLEANEKVSLREAIDSHNLDMDNSTVTLMFSGSPNIERSLSELSFDFDEKPITFEYVSFEHVVFDFGDFYTHPTAARLHFRSTEPDGWELTSYETPIGYPISDAFTVLIDTYYARARAEAAYDFDSEYLDLKHGDNLADVLRHEFNIPNYVDIAFVTGDYQIIEAIDSNTVVTNTGTEPIEGSAVIDFKVGVVSEICIIYVRIMPEPVE